MRVPSELNVALCTIDRATNADGHVHGNCDHANCCAAQKRRFHQPSPRRAIDCMGERNGSFQLWKAAETFAILLPLASRSTILHMAAICGASLVRKFFPV
jgi:hypothetical protein